MALPDRSRGQCETVMMQCLLVTSPSFSVNMNPRLGSILRFMLTVNKASFDIFALRRLDYPCFRSRRLRLGLCRGGGGMPLGVIFFDSCVVVPDSAFSTYLGTTRP
jgi:hypothetical protein